MNRMLITPIAATAALGLAFAAPTKAAANPLIIAPAVAALALGGAIVGGVIVGSAAANAHPVVTATAVDAYGNPIVAPAAGPVVTVTDQPTAACYFTRARVHGVMRRVQVCD
jgi:hypothetical protein